MQVESGLAMQNLKPTIDNIKRLYGDDKKKIQRETSALYKKANVSPLAGMWHHSTLKVSSSTSRCHNQLMNCCTRKKGKILQTQ